MGSGQPEAFSCRGSPRPALILTWAQHSYGAHVCTQRSPVCPAARHTNRQLLHPRRELGVVWAAFLPLQGDSGWCRGQLCDRLERGWECGRNRPKDQNGRGQLAGSWDSGFVKDVGRKRMRMSRGKPLTPLWVLSNLPEALGDSWQTLCRSPLQAGSYQQCPGPGILGS